MAKKGVTKTPNPKTTLRVSANPITLREESAGKKLQARGGGGSRNPKSFLKRDHLRNLSLWATESAAIPSLAAFFSRQLAAADESLENPPDPSLFSCQRCETVLRPGLNCTIRIEKNRAKRRHKGKKTNNMVSNVVVFKCHFCSYHNSMRGTPKGYLKEICPRNSKPDINLKVSTSAAQSSKSTKDYMVRTSDVVITDTVVIAIANSDPSECIPQKCFSTENDTVSNGEILRIDKIDVASPVKSETTSVANSPATQLPKTGFTLLDAKKRKRNKSGKKKLGESDGTVLTVDIETAAASSSKRKRKTWTSLKDIVESSNYMKTSLFPSEDELI